MSAQFPARVWQQTTTTGTGTITLSGSNSRFRTFSEAFGSSAPVFYVIVSASGYEVGFGVFTNSGSTLTRARVLYSSNAGALVNLPSGTKDVFATYPGAPWNVDSFSGATHAANQDDHGNVKLFTGSSLSELLLLNANASPPGWMVHVVNAGTAPLVITPNSPDTVAVNGGAARATFTLAPGQSGFLYRATSSTFRFMMPAQHLGPGRCYLDKNGSNLRLSPDRGDGIQINGGLYSVKHAPELSPSGTSTTTLYYIYAYLSSGIVALEYSTTAPAVDTAAGNEGVWIKNGDASRSYVGMARTPGSAAWADTATQRFVLSFFNRRRKSLANGFTTNRAITASSFTEFNSEIRCEFLIFAGETVDLSFAGVGDCSSAGIGEISIAFDDANPEDCYTDCNSGVFPVAVRVVLDGLSAGYHYGTLVGKTIASGPLTIKTNANSAGQRSTLNGSVMG